MKPRVSVLKNKNRRQKEGIHSLWKATKAVKHHESAWGLCLRSKIISAGCITLGAHNDPSRSVRTVGWRVSGSYACLECSFLLPSLERRQRVKNLLPSVSILELFSSPFLSPSATFFSFLIDIRQLQAYVLYSTSFSPSHFTLDLRWSKADQRRNGQKRRQRRNDRYFSLSNGSRVDLSA